MRRFFAIILLLFPLFFGCGRHDNNPAKPEKNIYRDTSRHDDYNVRIAIPTAWIEKVRHFDYTRNIKPLLTQFEGFIKPDSLVNPHAQHVDEGYGRVFNPIFANLDGEPGDEMICLLGWDITSPYLCVFKQINGNWYLLYLEDIDTFYSSPSLSIADNFSKNKVFYFKRVYEHGSGIFKDGYTFYKLINNKVYKCLNLLNDVHIYGWGLYMNQAVTTSFEFSGDESDRLDLNYVYSFFPGAVKDGDCAWCANPDIPLVKGDAGVGYIWDNKQHIYKLEILSWQNTPDDLNAKKIACFGDFGNDTLFVDAFHDQLTLIAKEGTPQQKAILKKYLALVKKNKVATTQKLKVTTQIGGTTFYGPDTAKNK
ncbi:hypothetical protein [Mucilaginibacter sp. OK283]|jgi:hypothetical protein|uniref:hypothetical protein n=1 Tax=Mucilaginibacter sp. OK283 TaxID=1881049 RepID=UPI0008AB569B|nr:hypothetical protein [Mucilaginibacter sp. OK283]SEP42947.1 hypothetical protein SAMN05428947_11723 [Mucilaginibacter sp. OK283]